MMAEVDKNEQQQNDPLPDETRESEINDVEITAPDPEVVNASGTVPVISKGRFLLIFLLVRTGQVLPSYL
jgi:hypothetical protein